MNFNVKCIRGPYWLPDEIKNADEHFGYDCLLNGEEIIVGEEPVDGFRYIYLCDNDTYDLYAKNKTIVAPLIKKAIEAHKLKSTLTPNTQQTFNNLIDEL
jgi:hypothetical protein